jgi:hypothetical protein
MRPGAKALIQPINKGLDRRKKIEALVDGLTTCQFSQLVCASFERSCLGLAFLPIVLYPGYKLYAILFACLKAYAAARAVPRNDCIDAIFIASNCSKGAFLAAGVALYEILDIDDSPFSERFI